MQKTPQSKLLTLYEGVDFSLALEYTSETAIIHLGEFKKFTPSSFRTINRLKDSWFEFLQDMGYSVVYAGIPRQNHKTKKLAMKFGFKYIGAKDAFDIYIYGD